MSSLHTMQFDPAKLALVAPDVSLQKYLEIGLRPSLRKFAEFRPVVVSQAGLSRYQQASGKDGSILGSSLVKSGNTDVICTVSAGIVEDADKLTNDYHLKLEKDIMDAEERANRAEDRVEEEEAEQAASVYTVVEIAKGRNGPPTEEEMGLSQKLYEVVLHSGLISKESLHIDLGLKSKDANGNSIVLRSSNAKTNEEKEFLDQYMPKKSYSYCLYAKIQVYSRTGPLFDLCYGALLEALKNTRLPEVYINERETDVTASAVNSRRGRKNDAAASGTDLQAYDLLCDPENATPLPLDGSAASSWSSTFAIADNNGTAELLADPEGEAEDHILKTVSCVASGKTLYSLEVTGQGVTRDQIKQAIELSERRAGSIQA